MRRHALDPIRMVDLTLEARRAERNLPRTGELLNNRITPTKPRKPHP
jgi:hypothetical protein